MSASIAATIEYGEFSSTVDAMRLHERLTAGQFGTLSVRGVRAPRLAAAGRCIHSKSRRHGS